MKEHFTDFYEAWKFLSSHPANSIDRKRKSLHRNYFLNGCLSMMVVKANPNNNRVEITQDMIHLNTKTRIWLEYGEVIKNDTTNKIYFCHDVELDCSGDTFEEVIINLANNVKNSKRYRDMEPNYEDDI